MAEKVINYIKNHLIIVCGVAVAVIALIIVLALIGGDEEASEVSEWGDGITADIPALSAGDPDSVEFGPDGSYAAAYFSEVTSEQVAEYISTLENQLKIDFPSDKYPCSAIYGDKIIVIHYNVTEMRFSVTVTEKTNISGEQK